SYLNVKPIPPPPADSGEGSQSNPHKRSKTDDTAPAAAQSAFPSYGPPRQRYNPDLEDDAVSVASSFSQSPQVPQPYYPSAFGQYTGPYNPAFRKPNGGPAVPGVLDHQRRSDYYNIRGKTHDATANYNAKFNATYNAIQGTATPPTFERVVETLQTVEANEKIANHKLEQFKLQQRREKRQQFQPPQEPAHVRIDRLEYYNANQEQTLAQHNNYFPQIGEDIIKLKAENVSVAEHIKSIENHIKHVKNDIYQTRWAFDLLFEELCRTTILLDRVAEKAEIPTYSSVLTKEILEGYIGSRDIDVPIANADQSEPYYRHHEYVDEDTPITDADPENPEQTTAK
ncbi:hypothetical protein HDU76_010867, partial [Blyttiomyces sp. JEL0837]